MDAVMKGRLWRLLLLVLVVASAAGGAAYGVEEAVWTGLDVDDNLWRSLDNWSGLVPGDDFPGDGTTDYNVTIADSTERDTVELDVVVVISDVTIDSDMTVEITSGATLDVGSGDTLDCDGTVKVFDGGEVRIRSGATHTLDGTIQFMNDPNVFAAGKLSVGGNTTITGSGTIKRGDDKGILAALDFSAKLTLDTNVKAEGDLDITVKLTNNGTVHANVDDKTIRLQTTTKDGGGLWKASNGGKLQVDVAVSGAGDWAVDEGGEIEFNTSCADLEGDLTISGDLGSKVDVNAAVESCGHLNKEYGGFDILGCIDNDATFVWGGGCD